MKDHSLKIILIICMIGLIIGAIYMNLSQTNTKNELGKIGSSTKAETIISNHIRIGMIEFDNMNPILSNNKNVQDISRLIFDPLFTLTEDYQLKEALATECSKLDQQTYLIKLRENVKWQDGNKFDASDVIFTIKMLKKKENHSVYAYNVAHISSAEEIDESTIKIVTDQEIPYFEYNLIFPIVSSHYFSEEDFDLESKNIKPVGTGLFYISDVGNNRILLKRNVNGWDTQIMKLDSITLNLCDSLSDAINLFKSGEIDLFTTSNTRIEEYLKNTNYNQQQYINRNYAYLTLNCNHRVLSNVEVRQAISYAIQREDIIKNVYNGKYQLSNFPLDYGSYVYASDNAAISYNKNTAKKILVDAGWKYSSKKWRKTVHYRYLSIDLKLVVNKTNSNMVKVANQIKEQLESVGIRITVVPATQSQYDQYLKNKNYDMILSDCNYGYSPSLDKYFQKSNMANYENDELNTLLKEAKETTDKSKRMQLYSQITQIYHNDVPYISLYYNTNTFIYSNNLKGSIHPNSYNLFYNIESWYREYK